MVMKKMSEWGRCDECIFSIFDLDGWRKCILHDIVVGDSDVCTKFLSRKKIIEFIEIW